MQKLDIKKMAEEIKGYFSLQPEIKVGYLFGSMASGRDNKLSDIDIGILIDDQATQQSYPYGYKAKVLTGLLKLLKTNKVDLVILNTAPSLLRHRVIYGGRLLYTCDEAKRIEFQLRTLNEYSDIKRLLSIHQSGGRS